MTRQRLTLFPMFLVFLIGVASNGWASSFQPNQDFNGDGRADILWRHSSGAVYTWFMNGMGVMGTGSLGGASADWRIVGVGDFNGDGKADILWRHSSGAVHLWLMNGTTTIGSGSPGSVASDWTIAGVGDFNGDGKADILWRHSSGAVYIWFMNGTSMIGTGSLGSVSPDWTIVGVGDFNGDGKADILWRHSSGAVHVWLMNGPSILDTGSPGGASLDWTIAGVGDFDGDGKADILWRHNSGAVYSWFMNGTALSSGGSLGGASPDWAIVDVGDFNGDGKADILWRHRSGAVHLWLMNGPSVMDTESLGGCSLDWTIMGGFMMARAVTGQTHLDPNTLTKYLDPLPVPGKLSGTIPRTITISEFTQQVLPSNFTAGPYGGKTLVWGYNNSYPGPTVEATRDVPFSVTFQNHLDNPALLPYLPVDQTLHWADPLGCARNPACAFERYNGPVPVVTHLHGGEVPSAFDGNPEAWFTPGLRIVGPAWVADTYTYPNSQEAATLWYHDHTLGMTRLNVYAGLAGFYLLRDPLNEPANLPSGSYEREIVIQDRMFDTNGQLLYPTNGNGYSEHPFWVNMFMGDTIVVNGKAWPYLNVEPRRYRMRLLNGSNSRIYTLQFKTTSGQAGPSFWQIGTDGGLLNKPINVTQLTIAPGERVDVIVDFTGQQGTSYILENSGSSFGSSSVGEIMKINVSLSLKGTDTSLNPSTGPNLRPNNPIVQLSPTVNSSTPTRHMTLERDWGSDAFLLNGKLWDDPITEKPRVGATEVWKISNRTGDAHSIHLHLVQFQILGGGSRDCGSCGGSDPNVGGWKDTVRVGSWDSVSIVVRWAPQDTPAGTVQPFPFDPTSGPGYLWHCHILEHEDNEMMRPYLVIP